MNTAACQRRRPGPADGLAALAVHAGLGLLLLLGSIALVVRAVVARTGFFVVTSVVTLLAVLGAAGSGASFVNAGQDGASLAMGLLTAVALLFQLINLFRTADGRAGWRRGLRSRPP